MVKNYFKTAWRNLLRNKAYAGINIAGLTLGLACAMLIVLYVKDEVSYDRFHQNGNNIYRIVTQTVDEKTKEVRKDGNSGFLQGPRFTENVPGIKAFVRIQSQYKDIKTNNEVKGQEMLSVDTNFFAVFSFPLLYGNASTCLQQPKSIVLSEAAAKKQFGTTDVLGKLVMLKENEGFAPYTVTAVTKKCPQNSSIKFDMLLPFVMTKEDAQNNENWFNFFLNTFVVLEPTANQATIEKRMQHFYAEDSKEAVKSLTQRFGPLPWKSSYQLQPFLQMHLSKDLPPQNGLSDASNPLYSYILSGIALFILLIACINFVNLTVARSIKRAKEIGIRKVIGSDRKQLVFQFMGESFMLCFAAFIMAIGLVLILLPLFNTLSNKALSLAYLLDTKLLALYVLLFLFTSLLAGFYPALVLSNYNPVQTLYSRFNMGGKNYLQRSLVVLQFSLASFLIIATLVIYAQFNFLTTRQLGYDDTNMVIVKKDNLTRQEAALLKTALLHNPSITGMAPKNGGSWGTMAHVNNDSAMQFAYQTVDENYIPILGIQLKEGRNFSPSFPSDSANSVLVNEAFVKKAGWKKPLGQVVDFFYQNKKYTVVGVVKDYHFTSLNEAIKPELFTMKPDNAFGMVHIKIKPGTATASLEHIKKTFRQLFPINPYSYTFKSDDNIKQYEQEAKWKSIMLFGAVLTIFISCIGLFGLSVLSAQKRTKEIGIRKVLGASVGGMVAILSKDFLKLVFFSLLIAVPIAWIVAGNWLQNYPYRISLSWMMFAGAGIMVIGIALFTISFQAIRAAIANPVKSLRTE